jgi:membrane protein involved in colicin uptake
MTRRRREWKQLELFRRTAAEIRRLECARRIEELKELMRHRREEEARRAAAEPRYPIRARSSAGYVMPIVIP